jgi:hypothetical protein
MPRTFSCPLRRATTCQSGAMPVVGFTRRYPTSELRGDGLVQDADLLSQRGQRGDQGAAAMRRLQPGGCVGCRSCRSAGLRRIRLSVVVVLDERPVHEERRERRLHPASIRRTEHRNTGAVLDQCSVAVEAGDASRHPTTPQHGANLHDRPSAAPSHLIRHEQVRALNPLVRVSRAR